MASRATKSTVGSQTGLRRVAAEPPLDRNYIEREAFDRVSSHVDWRSLSATAPASSRTSVFARFDLNGVAFAARRA